MEKLLATVRIVVKETPPYLQLKHFFKVNKTFISYTLILILQQLYGWYIFPHQPWEVVKLSKDFWGTHLFLKYIKMNVALFYFTVKM